MASISWFSCVPSLPACVCVWYSSFLSSSVHVTMCGVLCMLCQCRGKTWACPYMQCSMCLCSEHMFIACCLVFMPFCLLRQACILLLLYSSCLMAVYVKRKERKTHKKKKNKCVCAACVCGLTHSLFQPSLCLSAASCVLPCVALCCLCSLSILFPKHSLLFMCMCGSSVCVHDTCTALPCARAAGVKMPWQL